MRRFSLGILLWLFASALPNQAAERIPLLDSSINKQGHPGVDAAELLFVKAAPMLETLKTLRPFLEEAEITTDLPQIAAHVHELTLQQQRLDSQLSDSETGLSTYQLIRDTTETLSDWVHFQQQANTQRRVFRSNTRAQKEEADIALIKRDHALSDIKTLEALQEVRQSLLHPSVQP